jgi:hypothetical protein
MEMLLSGLDVATMTPTTSPSSSKAMTSITRSEAEVSARAGAKVGDDAGAAVSTHERMVVAVYMPSL